MRILITGGTGFLGKNLAQALIARGDTVTLLGRNFTASQQLIALGALPLYADLRDHDTVIRACRNQDVVCHAGALSAPWGRKRDFYAINVGGTAALIAGCRRADVARLVHISSPATIFTGGDHIETDESAPYPQRFSSHYAASKKLAEELVRAAPDLPSVILRPKAIFGPGDQALLPRLIAAARAGRLPQIGAGRNRVDMTYIDNVVHAILLSITAPAAGKTYFITNGEHIVLWELIRTVLAALGLNTNLRRVPLPIAFTAASLMEARATLTGQEPLLTRYTVAVLARHQTYTIAAAQRDLGYHPVVSVADGVRRTIADLAKGGFRIQDSEGNPLRHRRERRERTK
ncbi:NAD-dependent epimerase/dehydratase family protein [Candidatus Gracilibacteria bacterium]|nr:NAD-dependent epimerase/dehydratase family protein [Candidatus Gracilibacteria bacterium]